MSSGFIETGLTADVVDIHRALASLQEELEAIDSYHQRIDASQEATLNAILAHNRDEEMEHAAMLMAWLAQNMPVFGAQMNKFLVAPGKLGDGGDSSKPIAGLGKPRHAGIDLNKR